MKSAKLNRTWYKNFSLQSMTTVKAKLGILTQSMYFCKHLLSSDLNGLFIFFLTSGLNDSRIAFPCMPIREDSQIDFSTHNVKWML